VLVYDRTCVRDRGRLTPIWAAGARLYRALGRIDAVRGVDSWHEALAWIASHTEPIHEIQYWGHGRWGYALVRDDMLDASSIQWRHRSALAAVRDHLAPDALVWFRSCQVFGARAGHDFAQRLSDFLGARVAGHTYIIGYHQSGLHGIAPGTRPDWPADEGLLEGTPDEPRRARWSKPWSPRTITALAGRVPHQWFARPTQAGGA
jgi:hypothetical protein